MNKLLIFNGIVLLMLGGVTTPDLKTKVISVLLFVVNYLIFFVK